MSKIFIAALIFAVALFAGCMSGRFAADGRQAENVSLHAMAHNTRMPEVGKVYIHKGGNSMKICQVLDDGVVVESLTGVRVWKFRGPNATWDKLLIYVETTDQYADGELLRGGLYEYIGPHKYTTVMGSTNTIRGFRKVPEKTE